MSGILIPFTKLQIQSIYNILKITEEDVQKSLEALKVWYLQQPHLPKRYVDTTFLRTVVLGSKNRIEMAKQRIENFFYYRNLYPDYLLPRPIDNLAQKLELITRFMIVAPKGTPDGYRVIILRPDYEQLNGLIFDIMIPASIIEMISIEDDTFGGAVTMIFDGSNIKQTTIIRFAAILKYFGILFNDVIPWVLKEIICVNVGVMTEQGINIAKTILKNKIVNKIEVIGKDDIEKLYDKVPKEVLPEEFGGLEESYDVIREKYYNRLMDMHDWFGDMKSLTADETLRPKNSMNNEDNEFGVEGTFKTLTVD